MLIANMLRFAGLVVALFGALPIAQADDGKKGIEFFEKKIRPVLTDRCYSCHSAKAEKVKGGLLLDTRTNIRKGGNMGAAVDPGNVSGSMLVKAIRYHDKDLQMPPKEKLSDAVIKDFEAWIRMGAPDPREGGATVGPVPVSAKELWSFQPVVKAVVPKAKHPTWARSDIDRFILAKLEEKGLKPAPPADKRTLLRRATFDLTGLPPTPEEIDAFLKDESPGAFAKVVDRLLASPRYGERWGRHWMDLIRYADTQGDASDSPIPEAYLYRDYIIDAFNRDMPYDQFIVEQIAGDRLAFDDPSDKRFREKIIATGFVALARRFDNRKYASMHLVIENTLDTIGKAMLGMSIGCARCHDHKFDPITKEDYYAMYGFFSSTRYPHAGTEHGRGHDNLVPLTTDRKLFADARKYLNDFAKNYDDYRKGRNRAAAKKKVDALMKNPPKVDFAWGVIDGDDPNDTNVQLMGEPRRKGARVPRGAIASLAREIRGIPKGQSGRLQLARWIASPENPLTARVMANRIWQYHFGRGIVPTSSTFGSQGHAPSHPMLLDWLAREFVEGNWSIKNMHRKIMLSSAYRQSGSGSADREDPENTLIGRFSRRRLEGEAIRDALLATAGTLKLERPQGKHAFQAPDKINYTQHTPFTKNFDHEGRSVYLMTRRLGKHPFFNLFDGPDTNMSIAQRKTSTVPLQALFMMNSPFVRRASEGFAARVVNAGKDEDRLERAYVLAFARPPTSTERMEGLEYLGRYRKQLAESKIKGDATTLAWSSFCRVLLSSSEFMYLD